MKKLVYGIGMILLLCMAACSKDDGNNNYFPNTLVGRWYLYGYDTLYYTPGLRDIIRMGDYYYIEEKDRDYSLWEFEFYDNGTMKHRLSKTMPFSLSDNTIMNDYFYYKIEKLNRDSMILSHADNSTVGYVPVRRDYFIKIKK